MGAPHCHRCSLDLADAGEPLCQSCTHHAAWLSLGPKGGQAQLDECLCEGTELTDDLTDLVAFFHLDASAVTADTDYLWPNEYFEQATPAVRDELIRRIEAEDLGEIPIDIALVRLAFIGDDVVTAQFASWTATPPRWTQNLWIPVGDFAKQANWELIEGQRRALTMPTALPLRRRPSQRPVVGPSAESDACPHCGHALFTLLDIDAGDPRFAGWGLHGRVHLRACPACALLSRPSGDDGGLRQLIRFTPDGSSTLEVSGSDEKMEFSGKEITSWEIDPEAIPSPWRAGTWNDTVHVLGGHPAWDQDAEWGTCPDCSKTLRHLAWLSMWELSAEAEWGSLLVQVCTDCSVAQPVFQTS